MSDSNYYDFLGILPTASQVEIKKAYYRLALKYHPDTGTEKDDALMKDLNFIYSILSDPVQRRSYDDGIRYTYSRKDRDEDEKNEPEDYSSATFVSGLQVVDAAGCTEYVVRGDFLYYKVITKKKILFYGYSGSDYFRTKVLKIYSKKHNSFRKVPLFVVKYSGVEHIIFEDEFQRHWFSEKGFNSIEKKKAIRNLILGLAIIGLIIFFILNIKTESAPFNSSSSQSTQSCYPLTNGGNCYQPGEYCRDSDHGVSGVAGDAENITCAYNDGWRWEPS